MFTGIVTEVGEVRRTDNHGDLHITIGTQFDVSGIAVGASIACAGICLTVVGRGSREFEVIASRETLSKTTAATWKIGDAVNLERPLRVGDELGGHIVTGHVDATAVIVEAVRDGESMRMTFDAPASLAKFIAPKGSIALDGVSLTVNDVSGARFGVNVIAHTLAVTTFSRVRAGDRVNLEVDVLARYVARLVG